MYSTLRAPPTSHNLTALHEEAQRPSDDITRSKKKVYGENKKILFLIEGECWWVGGSRQNMNMLLEEGGRKKTDGESEKMEGKNIKR